MSGFEIERKYLVKDNAKFKDCASKKYEIKQGYIPAQGATLRIRTRNDEAFLTIKGATINSFTRFEFEKEITTDEAKELLKLCLKPLIEKTRYIVEYGQHIFEVDEFHGENEGLIVAEIELKSENEQFECPDFIAEEVTQDKRYRNSYLIRNPYSKWKSE